MNKVLNGAYRVLFTLSLMSIPFGFSHSIANETSTTEIARGGGDAPLRDRLRTRIANRDTLIDQRVKALREASWANLLKIKGAGSDGASLIPGFVSATTDNLGRMLMPTATHIAAGQI